MEQLPHVLDRQEELINLLQKNDHRVIELIYENYSHNLFNIILRIVKDEAIAQDVFQEAIIKIWRKGHYYERSKGSLYTWLVSVCKHAAIDKTRSKSFKQTERHHKPGPMEQSYMYPDVGNSTEKDNIHEMVAKLPEHQRTIIDLAYFHGFTHQEISLKLGIPEGTVKSRIRLAIKQLRKSILA